MNSFVFHHPIMQVPLSFTLFVGKVNLCPGCLIPRSTEQMPDGIDYYCTSTHAFKHEIMLAQNVHNILSDLQCSSDLKHQLPSQRRASPPFLCLHDWHQYQGYLFRGTFQSFITLLLYNMGLKNLSVLSLFTNSANINHLLYKMPVVYCLSQTHSFYIAVLTSHHKLYNLNWHVS